MYDDIAYYYHLTHQDLADDISFLLGQIPHPACSVLELGCGTGRLLFPFARAGHTITGLDSSIAMLDIARQQVAQESADVATRITLIQGDMTDFTFSQPFDYVLIPYNTIMHLDDDAVRVCLRHIGRALKPTGRLIIDTINPHLLAEIEEQPEFQFEQIFFDPQKEEQVEIHGRYHHPANHQLQLTWRYARASSPPLDATSTYHYRYPHQLQLLLQQSRLNLQTIRGDYDNTPFTEESDRLIILATPAR